MPENNPKNIIYVLSWTVYAALHLASTCPLVDVPLELLAVDACLHAALFAALGLAIRFVLRYAKCETLPPARRYSNFGVLALLTVALWTGTCWAAEYALFDETALAFVPLLPVRALTGLMFYAVVVLFFYVTGGHVNPDKNKLMIDAGFGYVPERDANIAAEPEREPEREPEPERGLEPESEVKPDRNCDTEAEIPGRVTVKVKQKIHLIPLSDIVYLQSCGDYVQIITPTGKYLKERTMKYFEEHLPRASFVRIHRSYIINVDYISSIESAGRQSQQVSLKTGEWLNVSITGYKALKAVLNL
ncbi:MAG: LytTR family transcriptional regulator DNA-binding domain-containing protein [Prevotellaceae bacterium]|jgi:hypothetical protein|nr:LytTR family transcriptional regulator DNA-binding domain-containing protein [Prevotellaceae bacterium]